MLFLFSPFTEDTVESIISSGVAFTTAGGFSIGDRSSVSKHVSEIEGNVPSVEGLPIYKMREFLNILYPDLKTEITFPKVKCVLFDMDGLLLNTEDFYSIAQQKILDRFGIKFDYEVKAMMMGRRAIEAAKLMIDHYGIGDKITAEDFIKERSEILDKLFPNSELLPGVKRLLDHLHKNNIPMAIATSSNQRHFDIKTEKHKDYFNKVFKKIITGDMVATTKPDPEIFQKAFEDLELKEVKSEEVLVFEDSPLGIRAGKAAGMKTVMVSEVEPKSPEEKPDFFIKNMLYFLPEMFGLPKF